MENAKNIIKKTKVSDSYFQLYLNITIANIRGLKLIISIKQMSFLQLKTGLKNKLNENFNERK